MGRVLGSSGCRSGSQGWGHCCDGDPGEAGWGWGFGGQAEIVWGHSTQTAPILERPRTLGGSSLPQGALSCDAASVQRVPPESPQVKSRLGLEPPLLAPQVSWGDASSQGTGRQQVTALSWVLCDTQTRGSGEPLQPGGRDAGQGPCHLGSSPGASSPGEAPQVPTSSESWGDGEHAAGGSGVPRPLEVWSPNVLWAGASCDVSPRGWMSVTGYR